jgi:hypothetical protein
VASAGDFSKAEVYFEPRARCVSQGLLARTKSESSGISEKSVALVLIAICKFDACQESLRKMATGLLL